MDIESLREFCLSLPHVTEDMAFGEDYLLFRVCDKIFACCGLTRQNYLAVKCNPEYAIELREHFSGVEPAWHWNKKYWNQLSLTGELRKEVIKELIRHSYAQIVAKLPSKIRLAMPELLSVTHTKVI